MFNTCTHRLPPTNNVKSLRKQAEDAGLRDFQVDDVLFAYEHHGWERALITLNYLRQTTQLHCRAPEYKSPFREQRRKSREARILLQCLVAAGTMVFAWGLVLLIGWMEGVAW